MDIKRYRGALLHLSRSFYSFLIFGLLAVSVITGVWLFIGKPYLFFFLAERAFKKNQCDEVIKYDSAIVKSHEYFAKRKLDVYYRLGVCHIGKDISVARSFFEKLVKEYPSFAQKQPDLYYNLGFSYLFNGKIYLAGAYFSKFLQLNPEYIDSEMHYLIGSTFAETGKNFQAIEELKKVPLAQIQYEIDQGPYYLAFARAYLGKNKFDSALVAADEVLAVKENNSPNARLAHLIKYLIFRNRGDIKQANQEALTIEEIGFGDLSLFEADQYQHQLLPYLDEAGWLEKIEFRLQSSLEISPLERAQAYTNLAEYYYLKKGEKDKSLELLNQAVKADPDYFWSYFQLGFIESAEDNFEGAIVFDQELAAIDENHPFTQNALGWAHYNIVKTTGFDKERLEKTKEHFQQALEADPEFPEANNNLGLVYFELKDDTSALKFFQKAIEYDPKYKKPYLNIGSIYITNKDYKKALEYYNKALELNPQYSLALQSIANVYFLQNKYNDAVNFYKRARSIDPSSPEVYNLLADTYEKMGQLKNAEEELKRGIQISKKPAELYIALSLLYKKIGRQEDSDNLLAEGLALQDKKDGLYHYNIGLQLNRQQRYEEAVENFKKAISLSPYSASGYIMLARAYQELKKYDDAVSFLNQALELESNDAADEIGIYEDLGRTFDAKGDEQEAILMYNKGLELAIKIQDKNQLHFLYDDLGLAYLETNRFDLAIEYFQKAIEQNRTSSVSFINLGETYRRKGLLDQAIVQYQQAIRLDPKSALAHNNLGYAYALQNRINEAVAEFKKALGIDPDLKIAEENLQNYQNRK